MPMIYSISLATPGNSTTSVTPNTEVDLWTAKAGVRNFYLQAMYLIGKAAQLTSISGIVARIVRWGTASTVGTGITPTPKDPGMQAAKATCTSLPTAGSTRTNRAVFGCGAAGPGGWVAPNQDSMEVLEGSSAQSIDAAVASGTASLNFEWSAEFQE